MTNGERIRACSNEQFASLYYNLKEWALYSEKENRRLLNDTPEDFLIWLNKETEDFEEDLFKMRNKKITLSVFHTNNQSAIDIFIPFYKTKEDIEALFLELFGVEYNSEYCAYIFWD